jgi:plastocyanin
VKQARKLVPLAVVAAALLSAPAASAAEQTFVGEVPTGTIGPYEVRQEIKFPVPAPPGGGYITKMETDIVDATTGDPVPIARLMLHHIVFATIGRPDSTCHNQGVTGFDSNPDPFAGVPIQRFYAAGEERAKMSLPSGYGYEIGGTPYWGMTYMVMNHRAAPDNAVIQYKVTYEDDPVGEGLTAVTPWWLDVRDCRADPIYNVPGAKKKAKKRKGKKGKGKQGKGKKPAAAPTHTLSKDYTFPAGRIVAGGGHVHGGAYKLTVSQPNCSNRQIAESNPTWGLPDHPFYTVRPVLHEPGPINMSAFQSQAGIPVGAGSTIRLNSLYDNSRPHTRVMGIFLVYLAPPNPGPPPQSCDALPGDVQTFSTDQPGRTGGPIPYTIPLTGLNAQGQAVTIDAPPGKLKRAKSGSVVEVKDRLFAKPNLRLNKGDSLKYFFTGNELHNLTLANGPLGIGSDNLNANRVHNQKFTRTGTYRLFCGLHPVQMSQRVVVKKKKKKKKKK